MAKEKKLKSTSDSQQETRVLLEQIRLEVKIVSEQHGSIMHKLEEHDQKFDKIELKLLSHDAKFANIDERFDRVEVRLDRVEAKLGSVEGRLDRVEGKIDRIENVITGTMSEHETRIRKLEENPL